MKHRKITAAILKENLIIVINQTLKVHVYVGHQYIVPADGLAPLVAGTYADAIVPMQTDQMCISIVILLENIPPI